MLLFLLESLGYQCQDSVEYLQQYQKFTLLGDIQMLFHILQELKASEKRVLKLLTHCRYFSYGV
jgi:hypothetical protein